MVSIPLLSGQSVIHTFELYRAIYKVSIPLLSGQSVIIKEKLAWWMQLGFNPLIIGSICNDKLCLLEKEHKVSIPLLSGQSVIICESKCSIKPKFQSPYYRVNL